MRDLKAVKMQNLSIRIPVKCFTGLIPEIHSRPTDQTTGHFKSLKTGNCIYKKIFRTSKTTQSGYITNI